MHRAIPAAIKQQIDQLIIEADALAGGDVATYFLQDPSRYRNENWRLTSRIRTGRRKCSWLRCALCRDGEANGLFYIRGETGPFGQYQLFVPRDGTLLSVDFYDPRTKRHGLVFPYSRPEAPFRLPRFYLFPLLAGAADFDIDGLTDLAEFVVGTSAIREDSDGDGVPDAAEMAGRTRLTALPPELE
jgi:hypothetical protein